MVLMRYIILFGALIGIALWLWVAKRFGSIRYVLVPIFWLIMVALFSAERLYLPNLMSIDAVNSLSLGIRIYGVLVLVWMAAIILRSGLKWKE